MAWIESHQSLGTHRKVLALCEKLHIDRARCVGMLHFLWWWALDNTPDGDITGVSDKTLATVSLWKGSPTLWVQTLREVGLVDETTDTQTPCRTLHDWDDYAGKLVAKRVSNRRYQREHRERARKDDVRLTSGLRQGATVPNRTQPYPTVLTNVNTTGGNGHTEKTDSSGTTKKSGRETVDAHSQGNTGYGEFENVMLSEEERAKLNEKLGAAKSADLIEQLSGYMRQSPANTKKYKDHYATILNWARRDDRKPKQHVGADGWPRV